MAAIPSRLQLALAIAVVKSKPTELSVKDYILHLREHVRGEKKGHDGPTSGKHIDAAGYWAQRFNQAETAKLELEAKVTDLEREIERLKSDLNSAQSGQTTRVTAASTKSRKRASSPGPSTRSSKRAKLEREGSNSASATSVESSLPEDIGILSAISADGSRLVRHLYEAHKLYKDGVQVDRSLAYHLVHASDCLGPLLASACKQYQQRVGVVSAGSGNGNGNSRRPIPEPVLVRYNNELTSAFEAAARTLMSLLYGLKKLTSEQSNPEDCGAVVCSFVDNFSHLLDTLTEVASAQATQEAEATDVSKARKRIATRQDQKVIHDTQQASLATRLLSNFALNILAVPSSDEPKHKELLEGFLFILFRRVGARIFRCTFGHNKCDTIEGDISAWTDPAESDKTPPVRQKQIEERALELELPILMSLLERGLAVAKYHIAPFETVGMSRKQPKAFAGKSGPRPSLESLKSGLSLAARKKMEHTLTRAIFGDDPSGDEMTECLTMPVRQALIEPPPKVEQEDTKTWFMERAWELVGWEGMMELE